VVAVALVLSIVATASTAGKRAGEPFRISGSVAGLYPGSRLPLRLTLTNPNRHGIRVTSLDVGVRAAGRACRGSNLTVSKLEKPRWVRRRDSRVVMLWATLAESAPAACRGARFELAFSGRAVRE
jgi:hypothetical protein